MQRKRTEKRRRDATSVELERCCVQSKRQERCSPLDRYSKKELLQQLDVLLSDCSHHCYVAPASSITSSQQVKQLRERWYSAGSDLSMIVFTEAISADSLQQARQNLAYAITCMWQEQLPDCVKEQLLQTANLSLFNPYRNCAKTGCGNASFAYLGKQPPSHYVSSSIQGESVCFDLNSVYAHVNLPLLLHSDNRHTLALHQALSRNWQQARVSCDTAKYASDPSPKPKTMTPQALTGPHMDLYQDSLQRQQALINADEQTKLFYVPGSDYMQARLLIAHILCAPCLYQRQGYVAIKDEELLEVLYRHAVAAPPRALTLWKSGVIHFEGSTQTAARSTGYDYALYPLDGVQSVKNSVRLRFAVGTQQQHKLERQALIKLALLAEEHVVPAMYPSPSDGSLVHQESVALRTTLRKQKRQLTLGEEERRQAAVSRVETALEQNSSAEGLEQHFSFTVKDPLKRHLYGVSQPLSSLPFSELDQALLAAL